MHVDVTDRSLGLISAWQVLRKLFWEIELIKATPDVVLLGAQPADVLHVQDARLYASINAAMTSLSLVDWLFHSIRKDVAMSQRARGILCGLNFESDKEFLRGLRETVPSINACHQIANACKHSHLRTPDKSFKVMTFELICNRADGGTDIGVGAHIMRNGGDPDAAMPVLEMLEGAAVWWETLLEEIQLPDRELFLPHSTREASGKSPW